MQHLLLIFYVIDTAVEKIEVNKFNTKQPEIKSTSKKD